MASLGVSARPAAASSGAAASPGEATSPRTGESFSHYTVSLSPLPYKHCYGFVRRAGPRLARAAASPGAVASPGAAASPGAGEAGAALGALFAAAGPGGLIPVQTIPELPLSLHVFLLLNAGGAAPNQ